MFDFLSMFIRFFNFSSLNEEKKKWK